MAVLIQGGRLVTATSASNADVLCERGVITRIERSIDPRGVTLPPGERLEVVDARDRLVFPGFIDPHVHVYLPFMGTFAKDDWASASRAALVGGTTTLIEMICPGKGDEPLAAYETWAGKAAGRSFCDYSFHMGVTRWDALAEEQLREIVTGRGIRSLKVFLAYKGALGVDDRELYHALKLARELGVVVTAHCENETLIAEKQAELLASGRTGPEWHEPSRPARVEALGVEHLAAFAQATGAEVYVVHTSCRDALDSARAARARGVRMHVETVAPYLTLDSTFAERGTPAAVDKGEGTFPAFEGAKYVMSPPIRDRQHQEALWKALADGTIDCVGTDHAPFDFKGQKEMGRGDFTKIPNGIPSVEHRVDLMHTFGVRTGRIDLHRFVDALSTRPARIFGLKGKGDLFVGADADIVVYDPEHRSTISASTHHMRTDYSAWEGWEVRGRSETVLLRGEIVVRGGVLTVRDGEARGRLTPRQ
jgi:dihydropyrimidinase